MLEDRTAVGRYLGTFWKKSKISFTFAISRSSYGRSPAQFSYQRNGHNCHLNLRPNSYSFGSIPAQTLTKDSLLSGIHTLRCRLVRQFGALLQRGSGIIKSMTLWLGSTYIFLRLINGLFVITVWASGLGCELSLLILRPRA